MNTLIRVLCLVGAIGLALAHTGCGRQSEGGNGNGQDEVVVPVEIAQVTQGDIATYFTGTASLEAEEETEVVAKVGGTVKRILVEEGDYVRAGQVLAKLDDEKIAVQMEQATANLHKLEDEYGRAQELFDAKLMSAQEFQRAKYEYEHQKASFDLCELDLEYTSICTPISGVVAQRMIKVGNMVLPNAPTFRVTGGNPLLAVLHVPERQIGKLRVRHQARIRVDALPDEEFDGYIERISPVVDPATGTVKVTVAVKDRGRRLKPGMFARVHIIHDMHANAMLVPKDAVILEDEESSVFVVRDSLAVRQMVETGYVNTLHIEILSGLEPGDTVVTIGKGSLKDSTRVEFVVAGKAKGEGDTEPAEGAEGADAETGVEGEPESEDGAEPEAQDRATPEALADSTAIADQP